MVFKKGALVKYKYCKRSSSLITFPTIPLYAIRLMTSFYACYYNYQNALRIISQIKSLSVWVYRQSILHFSGFPVKFQSLLVNAVLIVFKSRMKMTIF